MDEDWWPDLLAHIPNERPWAEPHVPVARIQPYDDPHFPGVRMSWSALAPADTLEAIRPRLRGFGWHVEATGPRPGPRPPGQYEPRFWIQGVDLPQERYEPLVLSWETADQTTLQFDPGFLMTYGLVPRHLADNQVHYDDPATPSFDVAKLIAVSRHDAGHHEPALATIERDFLQDYLTLRGTALVEVYYEIRRGDRDDTLEAALEGEEGRNIHLSDREFQIQRRDGGGFVAQVWGARILATPGELPVTQDPLDENGLAWPGLEGEIDNARARRFRPFDVVYVRDTVLGAYEGKPGFDVYPESGGVHFRNQWGVSWCRRVGRDLIQLEIKKIYEGAHPRAIRHWHSYAVEPPANAGDAEFINAANIGTRARAVLTNFAELGDRLAGAAARAGVRDADGGAFTRVDRVALAGNDWWRESSNAAIARHIPIDLPEQAFLERCVALSAVVGEGLGERPLRRLANGLGVPSATTNELRSLKLLDLVIRLAQVSIETGMPLTADELFARLGDDGAPPTLSHLFALNDLRQLGAHDAADRGQRVLDGLARFDVRPDAVAGGFGLALDRVYDLVIEDLRAASRTLRQAAAL